MSKYFVQRIYSRDRDANDDVTAYDGLKKEYIMCEQYIAINI